MLVAAIRRARTAEGTSALDHGKRRSAKSNADVEPIDLGIKSKDPSLALCPSELMVHGDRVTMVVSVHNGGFGDWKTYFTHSDDSCRTWSTLEPAPGKLADRTFIRNHIVTRDGRIMMPFQHFNRTDVEGRRISKGRRLHTPRDPRNGVIISSDGGKTWNLHGDVRITKDDEQYIRETPSAGVLFRRVASDRLTENQLKSLLEQVDRITKDDDVER